MSDDITIGELGRTVVRIESDVRDIKAGHRTFITREEYERDQQQHEKDLQDLRTDIRVGFAELKAEKPKWWQVAPILISLLMAIIAIAALAR